MSTCTAIAAKASARLIGQAVPVPVVSDVAGWAVEESIKWLVSRTQAVLEDPHQAQQLLQLLQDATLHRTVQALDRLTDLPQFEGHRREYEQLCEALEDAALVLAHAAAPTENTCCVWWWQALWRRVERGVQERSLCRQLQLYCAREEHMRLDGALQRVSGPSAPRVQPTQLQQLRPVRGPRAVVRECGPPRAHAPLFQHDRDLVPRIRRLLSHTRNIGIEGMGGAGKTTIAAAVFERSKRRFDRVVWLKVGTDATDMLPLLKSAFVQLAPQCSVPFRHPDEALSMLAQLVCDRQWSVLLVLDDVWNSPTHAVVACLNFATCPGLCVDASRLIVTTRDRGTLSDEPGSDSAQPIDELEVVKVHGLDEGHSQRLFHHSAFPDHERCPPPTAACEEVCSQMIGKCSGNPLALKVLGASVKEVLERCSSAAEARGEQQEALHCLLSQLAIDGAGGAVATCETSVRQLPPSLRQCFVDCAAFPSSARMPEAHLLHLFASNAPLHTSASVQAAARKLQALVDRNLLSVLTDAFQRREYCMHDILHEIALEHLQAREGNSACKHRATDQPRRSRSSFYTQAALQEAFSATDPQRRGEQSSACINHIMAQSAALHWPPMSKLRYLRLSGDVSRLGAALKQSRVELPLLNFLDLSGCTSVAAVLHYLLPAAQQLLHLDLQNCEALTHLPASIGRCMLLTHLNLQGCSGLVSVPVSLDRCSELQHLDLGSCTSLAWPPEMLNACSIRSLTLLSLASSSDGLVALLERLLHGSSHVHLKNLSISGHTHLSQLPEGIGRCRELVALNLGHCKALMHLPEALGSLSLLTHLDLRGCVGLEHVPPGVGSCIELISLDLRGCSSLTHLPDSIGALRQLTILSLGGCARLQRIPESLGGCRALVALDLQHCVRLTLLPDTTGSLQQLKLLILLGCEALEQLPQSIGDCVELAALGLQGCTNLAYLPDTIGRLRQLTLVHLNGCTRLEQVPQSLGACSALVDLDLQDCASLTQLPDSVGGLAQLTILHLHGCEGLQRLPQGIGRCSQLVDIDLHDCRSLRRLPDSVGALCQLTTLILKGCGALQQLPADLGRCGQLAALYLQKCTSLAHLPESLDGLSHLTALQLAGCESLEGLPQGLGGCTELVSLYLQNCKSLDRLPETIGGLSHLKFLILRGCHCLQLLPESLGRCSALVDLDLQDCGSLSQLPESIGSLSHLTILFLGSCHSLEQLPQALGECTALVALDLQHCRRLRQLPDAIGGLRCMRYLNLEGCVVLEDLPQSIGGCSRLVDLDLEGCRSLACLPESIGGLGHLTALELTGCGRLAELPQSLCRCSELVMMDLTGCSRLERLPVGVSGWCEPLRRNLRDVGA